MKLRKFLACFLLLACLLTSLTACFGGGDPSGSDGPDATQRYPIALNASVSELVIEEGKSATFMVQMVDDVANAPTGSYLNAKLISETDSPSITVEFDHNFMSENLLEARFVVTAGFCGEYTVTVRSPFTNVSCTVNVTVIEAETAEPNIVIGENTYDGSGEVTYSYTAPANGVLTILPHSDEYGSTCYDYQINRGERFVMTVDEETAITLNKDDNLLVTVYGNFSATFDVSWSASSTEPDIPEVDEPDGYSTGLAFELSEDETYYIVVGRGTCTDTELKIPAVYQNLPVKEIAANAFYSKVSTENLHNTDITVSVVIPSSIKKIGNYAFYYSSALTSVTIEIENGVFPQIGYSAFMLCQPDAYAERALDSVTYVGDITELKDIPLTADNLTFDGKIGTIKGMLDCETLTVTGGVDTVKKGAFNAGSNIASLHTINFNGIKTIEAEAFKGCTSLRQFNFEGLTTLGKGAFEESGIRTVTIPATLTSVTENAFYNCKSLGSVTLSDGVKSVGKNAFGWCSSLSYIGFGNTVTSIGESAFHTNGISGTLTIPSNVVTIGAYAFSYSQGITKLVMNHCANVRTVGEGAFTSCDYLTQISAEGLTRYGAGAFANCIRLRSVNFGIIDSIHSSVLYNSVSIIENISWLNSEADTKYIYKVGSTNSRLPTALVDLKTALANNPDYSGAPTYKREPADPQ